MTAPTNQPEDLPPRTSKLPKPANKTEVESLEDETNVLEEETHLEAPEGISTVEAARRTGMSVPWIKLHAADLGGRKTGRGHYKFPPDITIERVREKMVIRASHKTATAFAKEAHDGDIAQKVFDALDRAIPTREIVKQFGITPGKVRQLAQEWIMCGKFDENELAIIHGKREPPPAPAVSVNHGISIPFIQPSPAAPMPSPSAPSNSSVETYRAECAERNRRLREIERMGT
jgi:hypothetical protein